MNENKIRIKLESFDPTLLKIVCNQIILQLKITCAKIVGPIPLPIKKKIYCILRSPHVNKDSREHFEIKKYSRLLDIYKININMKEILLRIDILSGVKIILKGDSRGTL